MILPASFHTTLDLRVIDIFCNRFLVFSITGNRSVFLWIPLKSLQITTYSNMLKDHETGTRKGNFPENNFVICDPLQDLPALGESDVFGPEANKVERLVKIGVDREGLVHDVPFGLIYGGHFVSPKIIANGTM